MKLPFGLPKNDPSDRHLLVIDFNPNKSRVAYFHDKEGELIFGSVAQGATPEAAFNSLSAKPDKITDSILGIPFAGLTDSSTVIRFRRGNPSSRIDEDEIKSAISQIPPLDPHRDPFFEDLFNARVDGLSTLDPVERMGEVVELNYYQVYADKDLLDQATEAVKHFAPHPGLVPAAYAIAKLISQTAPKGALSLDIDPSQTEVSLSSEGHLVGIKSFDVGGSSPELFVTALEAALEEMDYEEVWPEKIYLLGTVENYERIRSDLLAFPWTKKVNMMSFPEINVFHPLSASLTLPADVGLNALSLLG
jgi:hypothetical protein